jgi:hypothetical protein
MHTLTTFRIVVILYTDSFDIKNGVLPIEGISVLHKTFRRSLGNCTERATGIKAEERWFESPQGKKFYPFLKGLDRLWAHQTFYSIGTREGVPSQGVKQAELMMTSYPHLLRRLKMNGITLGLAQCVMTFHHRSFGPIYRSHLQGDCVTLVYGTDRFSRNVGTELHCYAV